MPVVATAAPLLLLVLRFLFQITQIVITGMKVNLP